MPALRAAACVSRQSPEAWERLHILLFKTFFEECRNIEEEPLLFTLVRKAGADMKRFRADYARADVDNEILADHAFYVENFLGWGIPLALVAERFPIAGACDITIYRRAIDLALGRKKSRDA
jgi:predicted DsbA family dithiol-disulfide isomerase